MTQDIYFFLDEIALNCAQSSPISDIQNDLSIKIKIFSSLKIELLDKIEEIHFEQDINFCKRQILLTDFPPVKIIMFLKIKQMKSSFIFCNKMMKMK